MPSAATACGRTAPEPVLVFWSLLFGGAARGRFPAPVKPGPERFPALAAEEMNAGIELDELMGGDVLPGVAAVASLLVRVVHVAFSCPPRSFISAPGPAKPLLLSESDHHRERGRHHLHQVLVGGEPDVAVGEKGRRAAEAEFERPPTLVILHLAGEPEVLAPAHAPEKGEEGSPGPRPHDAEVEEAVLERGARAGV